MCSAALQTTSSRSRQALPDISISTNAIIVNIIIIIIVIIFIIIIVIIFIITIKFLLPRHCWQGGCAGRKVSHSSLSGGFLFSYFSFCISFVFLLPCQVDFFFVFPFLYLSYILNSLSGGYLYLYFSFCISFIFLLPCQVDFFICYFFSTFLLSLKYEYGAGLEVVDKLSAANLPNSLPPLLPN